MNIYVMTGKIRQNKTTAGNIQKGLYIGADGCRGGWTAAILQNGQLSLKRCKTIREVLNTYPDFDAFLIDMVIGLRSRRQEMRPDDMARKELGYRASTVFSAPCRQAVYAPDHETMRQENIRILGKSLSAQTLNIIPKIRELDELLEECPQYKNRLLESHPELCFARLNGAVVMSRKKEEEGLRERISILEAYLPADSLNDIRMKASELKCSPDDAVDAVCLAVAAMFHSAGRSEVIPVKPQKDERGLYMKLTVPVKRREGKKV